MVQAAIETMLRQKIGLDASSIGSRTIARAVEQRRVSCQLPDTVTYWHYLQSSPQELSALIEAVVVPETWFFRDREPFVCLSRYVMDEWLHANPSGRLRVLSAPCSTGEEPYSVAMTLLDVGLTAKQFSIEAVDVSQRAILKAEQGIYSKRSFRGKELGDKKHYFEEMTNGLKICSTVKNTVSFRQANLLHSELLAKGKYHVIFCRNLLIYLDAESRDRVIQLLTHALVLSGLLFVGAAETAQISTQQYAPISHSFSFAYRKISSGTATVKSTSKELHQTDDVKMSVFLPQSVLPNPSMSDLALARQCADRGQLLEAAQHCETYVNQCRTDPEAYLLLGEIYQGLDRLDAAEQAYQKAVYLNPQALAAMIHLSLLKEERGDRVGAERMRQRAQRLLATQNLS
jgi:chemotaxis protein methyltransferase WspC